MRSDSPANRTTTMAASIWSVAGVIGCESNSQLLLLVAVELISTWERAGYATAIYPLANMASGLAASARAEYVAANMGHVHSQCRKARLLIAHRNIASEPTACLVRNPTAFKALSRSNS